MSWKEAGLSSTLQSPWVRDAKLGFVLLEASLHSKVGVFLFPADKRVVFLHLSVEQRAVTVVCADAPNDSSEHPVSLESLGAVPCSLVNNFLPFHMTDEIVLHCAITSQTLYSGLSLSK